MIMPFGKYKGQQIDDLPISYIVYLLEDCYLEEQFQDTLKDIVRTKLLGEETSDYIHLFELSRDFISKDRLNSIINEAYKKAMIIAHPDKGGCHEGVIAINEFKKIILENI
jgi:hypothetical protein